MSEDQSHATVKEEALKEIFYADCTDEDVEFAKSRLVPQAAAPFATPVLKPQHIDYNEKRIKL